MYFCFSFPRLTNTNTLFHRMRQSSTLTSLILATSHSLRNKGSGQTKRSHVSRDMENALCGNSLEQHFCDGVAHLQVAVRFRVRVLHVCEGKVQHGDLSSCCYSSRFQDVSRAAEGSLLWEITRAWGNASDHNFTT